MRPTDYPKCAEDAFNRRDLASLSALWAPDLHYVAPGEQSATREASLAREQALFDAFPDIRADLACRLADDERLVIEGVLSGTQTGALHLGSREIAATGRRMTVRFVALFTFVAGAVAAEQVYYDRLDLLTQLGVVSS